MILKYPFSELEFDNAVDAWGCNCGPSALAFALQLPLSVARDAIPAFVEKGYTSPTMMLDALQTLGVEIHRVAKGEVDTSSMFDDASASLVRIQWTGPWYGRYAYGHTHWIATWLNEFGKPMVFDCNGGMMASHLWESEIVPLLIPRRGDGGWEPTHILRVAYRAEGVAA